MEPKQTKKLKWTPKTIALAALVFVIPMGPLAIVTLLGVKHLIDKGRK